MTYASFFEQDGFINGGVTKLLEVIAANSTAFQYSALVALSANVVGAKTMWDGKIAAYLENKEYLKLVAHTCLHTTWHLALYGATAISMQANIFSNPDIVAVALLGFTALSSAINIFSIYSAIKNYFAGPVPEIKPGKLRLESSFLSENLMKVNYNIPEGNCAVRSVLEVVKPNETEEEIRRLVLNSCGIASLTDASNSAFQNASINGTRISLEIPMKKEHSIVSEVIEHIERQQNGSWVELAQRKLYPVATEQQALMAQ